MVSYYHLLEKDYLKIQDLSDVLMYQVVLEQSICFFGDGKQDVWAGGLLEV